MTTYCLPGYDSGFMYRGLGVDPKPSKLRVYADPEQMVVDLAETPHSYRVKAICLNCKWEGQMRLPKGSLVTSRGKGALCPKCGCHTLTGGTLIASETPETDSSKAVDRATAEAEEHYEMSLEEWARRQATTPKGKR